MHFNYYADGKCELAPGHLVYLGILDQSCVCVAPAAFFLLHSFCLWGMLKRRWTHEGKQILLELSTQARS